MVLQVQFSEDVEAVLNDFAIRAKQSPEEFVRSVMLQHLEDLEDAAAADKAIREFEASGEKTIPLEEIMKKYGLED